MHTYMRAQNAIVWDTRSALSQVVIKAHTDDGMFHLMHLCMHAYVHACMYACVYACNVCMHAEAHTDDGMFHLMHLCMHACVHACMYACMHLMYVCMRACMCVCMHASHLCVHTYAHTIYTHTYATLSRYIGVDWSPSICINVYVYVCVHIYTHMHTLSQSSEWIGRHAAISWLQGATIHYAKFGTLGNRRTRYIGICICMYVCMYACIHVCMFAHVHVCIRALASA
jgi:hypothetical protein